MNKNIVGIDISKATFDVAFFIAGKWHIDKFDNNQKGFNKLLLSITPDSHIVMEASGSYYLPLALFLFDNDIKISVLNPLVIRRYSQMRLIRSKTDKKDAQTIAEYGMSNTLVLWQAPSASSMFLRQLYSLLELLSKQLHQSKRQHEAFLSSGICNPYTDDYLKEFICILESHKAVLESKFIDVAQSEYGETIERLSSIPGIGPKTAIMLTLITDNFKKFENYKQLIAYIGFSPRIFESGSSVRGKSHICKMGQGKIRKLLYLCSWSAKRCNKTCKAMYDRLKSKGKPERVIKVAIANKLIKQIFAIGKNKTKYDENYNKIVKNICF